MDISRLSRGELSQRLDDTRKMITQLSAAADRAVANGNSHLIPGINTKLLPLIDQANAMKQQLNLLPKEKRLVKMAVDLMKCGRSKPGGGTEQLLLSLAAIIISGAFTYFQNWKKSKQS